jgi:NTE family protein
VVSDCQIEDLPIRFTCNAVEVHSGKEYVFKKGSLYKAIRASGSIPSVFLPAKIDKYHFIDGGVLNPVPISLLSDPEKSLVVVVDVNGLENEFIPAPKKDESGKQFISLPGWLKDYQSKMRQFFPEEKKAESKAAYSSLELVTRSFDLLQDRFCELLLEKYPVDVKIKISRKQAGTLEFHRSAEMIEIGRIKTKEALDQLEYGNQ